METQPIDSSFMTRLAAPAAVLRAVPASPRQLVPAGIVAAALLVLVSDGNDLSWLAGLLAGAGLGLWLALRAAVSLHSRGAQGSPRRAMSSAGRTEAALAALQGDGWRFLHDVPGPDGSYDHIAVGHGGVILLESLSPEGVVTMRDGQPIVERHDDPTGRGRLQRIKPTVLTDAMTVKETVHRLSGRRIWVQSVVVFWSEFPAGSVADGRCVYIHGSRLAAWLSRRPHQLEAGQVDDVFADVALLRDAPLPLPVAV